MGFFYLLVALTLALLLSGMFALRRAWQLRVLLPYRLDEALLSSTERRFLASLDLALGPRYRVFAKVPVEEIVVVAPRLAQPVRERASARLAERRFDFLVCDAASLRVRAAIALREAGRRYAGSGHDKTLARVCRAAGLPLLAIRAGEGDEPGELAAALHAVMAAGSHREAGRGLTSAAASRAGANGEGEASGQDEERLLKQLAAAIRDDGTSRADGSSSVGRSGALGAS